MILSLMDMNFEEEVLESTMLNFSMQFLPFFDSQNNRLKSDFDTCLNVFNTEFHRMEDVHSD